jgi:hypothetical protein
MGENIRKKFPDLLAIRDKNTTDKHKKVTDTK